MQKSLDNIFKNDIDSLVADGVSESVQIEYKQELPGNRDEDKKEFLADVSSFANARGGDIIYGISAKVDANGRKTGEPDAVVPIAGVTPDEAKLRLEDMLRNGVAPRLSVQIKEITGWGTDGNGFVIVIRIPKSFASPHMVTYRGTSRFFSRSSAGKFQLDVTEIRSAVLATESQSERIRRFREERLGKIIADDTPVPLSSPHRLVMHVVPLGTFLNRERLDLAREVYIINQNLPPYGAHGHRHRFNLDGILTWSGGNSLSRSYTQLFVDGCIEAVYADLLQGPQGESVWNGVGLVASIAYEEKGIEALKNYITVLKTLGVSGPIAVSLSILGCKGSRLAFSDVDGHPIDRDAVILQDIILDGLDVDIPSGLKPLFDQVWNACGYMRSFNYTKEGVWRPR